MLRRSISILLAFVLLSHALLGGIGGITLLCFGGEHDHRNDVGLVECQGFCLHESNEADSGLETLLDSEFGCVDLELTLSEFEFVKHVQEEWAPAEFGEPCVVWTIDAEPRLLLELVPTSTEPWLSYVHEQRLALVMSTQLII